MRILELKHSGSAVDAVRHLDFPLEAKALEGDTPGLFEGYLSVFGNVDDGGDVVMPGAFDDWLAEWKAGSSPVPLLWQHMTFEPIGFLSDFEPDQKGLKVRGQLLVEDDPVARRAYAHVKAKSIGGMSMGYKTLEAELDPSRRGVRQLKKIAVKEGSLVTFPMNVEARVIAVKNLIAAGDMPSPREFEALLRDAAGFSKRKAAALAVACSPLLRGDLAGGDEDKADDALTALARLYEVETK